MQDAPLRRWLLSKDSRWQSLYRSQNTGNYDIIWKFFALLNVSIYDLWLDDTVQQSLYRQAIRLIDSLWQSLTHSVQSTVRLWRWKSYRQSRKSLRYLRSINLPKLPSLPIKDIPISLEFSSPQTLPKLPSPPKYLLPSRRGIAAVFAVIAVSSLTTGFYLYIVKDLPAPTDLINYQPAVSTKILSRNGTELFSIYEEENRSIVPLDDISPDLINATIALEDKNFYNHVGFDPIAIMRAVVANAQGKPMQGGSTITQQLVKNTLLTPEKTIRRKVRELIVAIAVDAHFTKQEILEMYFNQVSYGGATYGAQEAAERYFGTSASDISLAQASLLAGLPAAPSVYSPFGQYPQLAKDRQQQVLQRMVAEEFITQAEADAALSEDLAFRTDSIDIVAPHFVMYVRELLANQYGEDRVARGGLEVRTTIDLDIQAQASQAVREEVASLKNLNVTNGAALVTNPSTGEILAMVGSMDYFNFEKEGQVNATLRERQPGSSIKPVTYALAFENGFTPATTIEDAPVEYISPGSRPYRPRNYDGTFHGNVTLRTALANSYNIPAVKLLHQVGVDNLIQKAQAMGVTTWNDPDRYGLALTLGAAEVRMLDMMQVYGTLANQGKSVSPSPILEVKTYAGEELYRNQCALDGKNCESTQAVDPRVAAQVTDILQDNQARSNAFGTRSVLHIPDQEVAVKTGTSNDIRDNWTFGYTSDYVVGTWVGNFNNEPMSAVASGITGASPIWNEIMRSQLTAENPHRFQAPSGMIEVAVCVPTGTLSCTGCPIVRNELFKQGSEPQRSCSPDWFNNSQKDDSGQPHQQQ